MTAPARSFERRSLESRAVRPVARLVSAFVEPLFYWLGMLTPDGHPDNQKVVYTIASVSADALVFVMGVMLVKRDEDITWPYVGLVVAVLLFAAGVRYLMREVEHLPFAKRQGNGDPPPVPAASPPGPGSGA